MKNDEIAIRISDAGDSDSLLVSMDMPGEDGLPEQIIRGPALLEIVIGAAKAIGAAMAIAKRSEDGKCA